jgi:hypothetical protein
MRFLPFEVPIALSPTERQTHRVHRSEIAHLHRVASQSPRDSLAILHRRPKPVDADVGIVSERGDRVVQNIWLS